MKGVAMKIVKGVAVVCAFLILSTMPAVKADSPADNPPAPQDAAAAAKAAEQEYPQGLAFDQLKKMKEASSDTLYYAFFRGQIFAGWVKVTFSLDQWQEKPVVAVTWDGQMDEMEREVHCTDITYYDANMDIMAFMQYGTIAEEGKSENYVEQGIRKDNHFDMKIKDEDGTRAQTLNLPNAHEAVIRGFSIPLKYFGSGAAEADKISVMNDLDMGQWIRWRYMIGVSNHIDISESEAKEDAIVMDMMGKQAYDCLAFTAGEGNYCIDKKNGILVYRAGQDGSFLLVDKDDFANWCENGKWNEADAAIAGNILSALPAPAKPVADWKGKVAEIAKKWADKSSQIPPDKLKQVLDREAELDRNHDEKINNTETELVAHILAQILNEGRRGDIRADHLITRLYNADITPEIREALTAYLYGDSNGGQMYAMMVLVYKCWDDDLRDVLLDIIHNSGNSRVVADACDELADKYPDMLPLITLYMQKNPNLREDLIMGPSQWTQTDKSLLIGWLLDACIYGGLSRYGNVSYNFSRITGINSNEARHDINQVPYSWLATVFGWEIKDDLKALVRQDIVDFVKKNHYERNLEMFIGFLACQTPNLRERAAAKLKALTGQDFGEDFAKWYTWYNTNKDKLKWNEEKQQYTISE